MLYPRVIRAARAAVDDVKSDIGRHRRMCGQCAAALHAGQPARCCDTGWMLVKYERLMAAQLRGVTADQAAAAPVQGTLF